VTAPPHRGLARLLIAAAVAGWIAGWIVYQAHRRPPLAAMLHRR
jgi:uncharacterized membrane protein YeaQ/YmgE (transglycosylase-associated protein family)